MSKSKTQRKYNKRPFNKYGKSTFKKRVPYKKRRGKSKSYKLINSKQRKNRIKRTKKKYGGENWMHYLCCYGGVDEDDSAGSFDGEKTTADDMEALYAKENASWEDWFGRERRRRR